MMVFSRLALSLVLCLLASSAQALVLDNVEFVIMSDQDGDDERLKSKSEGLGKDKMVDIVFDIPVQFSKKTFRCDSARETPWRLERRVESLLELQGLIDGLLKLEKPRILSPAQKQILTRIPVCEPFILQLKIISRLLKGYDLVRVEKYDVKDSDSKEKSTPPES